MRKGKNGIRRIAALACSVALLATMLPAQVLAADEATSEPLAAVTSLEESGEEKAPEQGETGIQPETENACTKSEDCAAETHEEGCPKYVAPAEEEDTDPVVSCTKSEDCAAETHEEGCPKYVAPAEEGTASSSADNAKSEGAPVDPQEEKTQYAVMDLEEGEMEESSPLQLDVGTAEQFYALADILLSGKIEDGSSPTEKQQTDIAILGFSDIKDADAYNTAFAQVQAATLNITGEISLDSDFEGIGTLENPFKGNVYGNSHTITMETNVESTNSSSDAVGSAAVALFAYVDTSSGSVVFDQVTTAGSITVSGTCDYTAALIGYAQGSNQLNVTKCTNNATVTNTSIKTTLNSYAAASGMIGYTAAPLMMTECTNNGEISSTPDLSSKDMTSMYDAGAAGLVVHAACGTVQNCENNGTIFVDSSNMRYAGGLVCKMGQKETESSIVGCNNKGKVCVQNSTTPSAKGSKVYAGGIVALMESTSTNAITECSNYADITVYSGISNNDVNWNHQMVGGIAGDAAATYDKCSNEGDITVEVHMGCVMCVGGIAGGQQRTFIINNSTNSGNIYTRYEDTNTPSYSCIGGIIGLVYKLDSSGCVNTGNITSSIGKTISDPTYIGSVLGKNDSASCWTVDNFTSDCSVTVTNAGTGIVGVGGVTGGPSVGSVASSRVDTHVEITSAAPTYVGGGCGYETTTYATAVKDSTLMLDAKLNSDNIENGYLGGLAGRGSISATNTNVVLLSEGFGTIRPYIGQKASGQHGLELVNYVVYSNQPFDEKESGDFTVGEPICAILNGGSFAADTEFTAGTLATPTKDGAIFAGWYENAEFTGEAVATAEAGKTYYAKWVDLTVSAISMQYGDVQAFPQIEGVVFTGWESADPSIVEITEEGIKAVGVGETTITSDAALARSGEKVTVTVNVAPRILTYTLAGDDTGSGSITYNYSGGHHALSDSMTIKWFDAPQTEVTLTEGTDINYTYTVVDPEAPDGGKPLTYDYLPMPVGEYTVSFNLKNPNYTFKLSDGTTSNTLAVKVNVTAEGTQRAYLASAAPTANQNFSYTGEGVLPVEGTLNAYAENSVSSSTVEIGTFTVNIEGLNGTSFHSEVSEIEAGTNLSAISGLALPTDPGTYIITASAVNDKYYLYKSLVFTINKATVTVTAADKTVIAGDKDGLPSLNNPTEGKDYTVTGLAAGHSLTTTPTLNYSEDANVDAVATYSIIPSGAAADEKYYTTIQYVNGTLHVEKIAIIEGANQTWIKESGKDLVIRSNADFSDFLGVTVNDVELVQNQDYTAKSGSTIVTIKADYLNSLAAGDYKIAIVSDTGSAVTKFTVKAEAAGDSDTSNNDNTAGGNTGSTTTQSGSGIVYYTCPACGYHDWTAGADGYKCNHCGYVESVKQLSGYGNVKGVYEPKTSAAAAQSASATSSSAIPQTSDAMPVGLLGGVTVVAAAAFAALFVLRKRKHND